MAPAGHRPARAGRGTPLRRWGRVAALAVAVLVLAVGVPVAREARWSRQCAELGGRLERSTSDVEPLAAARTSYVCRGPAGQVLDRW